MSYRDDRGNYDSENNTPTAIMIAAAIKWVGAIIVTIIFASGGGASTIGGGQ